MNVRWLCPSEKHPAVTGPSRPRKNNACRFCLPCTSDTGKLVERTSPKLIVMKVKKDEARKKKKLSSEERSEQRELERFTVGGFDLREEYKRLLRCSSCAQLRSGGIPSMRVKRCSSACGRWGVAKYRAREITVYVRPGHDDWEGCFETLAHEVAHFLARGAGHGARWKTAFRVLCEEAHGFRPRIEHRYDHELTAHLKGLNGISRAADASR